MTPRQRWAAKNPEKMKAARARWRAANRRRELAVNAKWRKRNKARHRKLISKWKHANKGRIAESVRFRQARKRNATPSWLTAEHRAQMMELYELAKILNQAGFKTHVDHIVPLRGKLVCGLHVPWNLRLLPARDNMVKGRKCDV